VQKAYGFEAHGRMDLAEQTWKQVLQMDANNPDALGGLARAAKQAGNTALANSYLERLRAVQQGTPNSGAEDKDAQQKQAAQLQQAGKLAAAGKYAEAMAIYRQVFGATPPPGDWALVYYQTESSTEEGRPHAVAGLRALAAKYPDDPRYPIALGRILTFDAKTRAEGRKLLERYPQDRQADDALRQSLLWDSSDPAYAAEIRAYLTNHHDPALAAALDAAQAGKSQPGASAATAAALAQSAVSTKPATQAPQPGVPAQPTIPTKPVAQAPAMAQTKPATPAQTAVQPQNTVPAPSAVTTKPAAQTPPTAQSPVTAQTKPAAQTPVTAQAPLPVRAQNIVPSPPTAQSPVTAQTKPAAPTPATAPTQPPVRAQNIVPVQTSIPPQNNLQAAPAAPAQNTLPVQPAVQMPQPVPAAAGAGSAAEVEGYKALNDKHLDQAEALFKAVLEKEPNNWRALAGMGYIRMQQGNFLGAISFLEHARQGNPSDKDLSAALETTRFWFLMGEGQAALEDNDLTLAEKQYRAALALRPSSPEALAALAGTLGKAQQPGSAVPFYERVVQANPASVEGWRGLVLAQVAAGNAPLALSTDKRVPDAVHAQLMRDPAYMRALATAYSAVGRDTDAEKTLEAALQLPFAADEKKLKADTQVQLAKILLASNHLEQAATLYSQVLAADHANNSAWQGLTRVQHAMGHDQEALATVEAMPPSSYAAVMRDPGFEAVVASIYQAEKKLDVAEDLLEKAVSEQTSAGQKPSAGMEMQLAELHMERGDAKLAAPIYRQVLTGDPTRVDAWAGLIGSLHAAGDDKEAAAQEQKIPAAARAQLESSMNYLQTMGSVYQALGQSRQALLLLDRVRQYYAAQHTAPPADVDIQNAWLLYNSQDEVGLYRQLMGLGGRPDLTAEQSRTVQAIWTNWAVRRANQTAAAGNSRRALAILNAAARAFPDNPAVLKTLADGYARAGQPEQAVLIYKAQNMASASVDDYQVAVSAALEAGENKLAETWLRYAMAANPNDPRILILGARLEQARGNTAKAIDYYRASLKAMPPEEPGAELAAELRLPAPTVASLLPSAEQAQDLSILLAPSGIASGAQTQPYLPSYGYVYGYYGTPYGYAPSGQPAGQPNNGAGGGPSGVVPPYMTNPNPVTQPAKPMENGPQSRLDQGAYNLPSQAEVALRVRNGIARVLGEAATEMAARPASEIAPQPSLQPEAQTAQRVAGTAMPSAVAVHLGDSTPHPAQPLAETTDVFPTARYVANARAVPAVSSHPEIAAAEAAEIRRHQSDPDTARTGQSDPPAEDTIAANEENAQYTTPLLLAQNQSGQQIVRPSTPPSGQTGNIPNTGTQQYPQPRVAPAPAAAASRSAGASPNAPRRTVTRSAPARLPSYPAKPNAVVTAPPSAVATAPPAATLPDTSSASAGQPLGGQPYPLIGPPYPLYQPPTDAELMARNAQPLGAYEAQPPLPLTPRQQAESELASLEGSYSGWWGVTGIGRYRSGTAGLDQLTDVESPAEASTALGRSVRLTAVARPVFLNSGVLNPSAFIGSNVPYLGTMPANSANPPAQQFASGVGGELQLTTKNLGMAVGYTPSNFLIQNITGHLSLRLFNGHFTFFGDRDPVKDTQLSYAGLRDPATVTQLYIGHGWGGVVSSTGGARIDLGGGGSGFYFSADGGILHGYHVLNNSKAEGAMGAYMRVKNWPTAGSLTVGGSLFGMHYHYDEVGLSWGQGGYFSPDSYFLAAVPVTFNGAYRSNFHYLVSGAFGVETFKQDWEYFYPLDATLQSNLELALGCTTAQLTAHTCGEYPVTVNTNLNYAVNSEVSYRFGEHWYLGGFVSANNTDNYNTVSGGFFFRYALRRQHSSEGYPTGLFPVDGFRPLRVP
jgi:tetratricopeptide (TPR) repeat protein